MNELDKLSEFINLAQKNRKYPPNTAHGRRAALKLFATVLHPDERESLDLIEERMKEIYLSLISKHRENFSIKSLNTYKGRFLKVIHDYKKYGANPAAIASWEAKTRKYKNKDTSKDRELEKDNDSSNLSSSIHRHVHKIQISLEDGSSCALEIPRRLSQQDAS